jgi:phage replication-related protein YjqB (UPF0714/DUF867 family)
LEIAKMSNNQSSFEAEFKLDPREPDDRLAKEHCMANRIKVQGIGRHRNEQVRIAFPTSNGTTTSAIYTVSVFHPDEGSVILGYKIPNLNCILSGDKCKGVVKAEIMGEGLNEDDDDEANKRGELIEHLNHENQNRKLVVIAPHGGEIEGNTDKQAEYVWSKFSRDTVSLWTCKGFSIEGLAGAFQRWHITSTEINEKSFPKLNTIFGSKFEYSIAFHGWTEDSICVGGNAESADAGLIGDIKKAISDALKAQSSDIKVNDPNSPEGCPEGFNGNNTDNIVNKLGIKGIQIEQCDKARDKFHDVIAQAVVDVIGLRINV